MIQRGTQQKLTSDCSRLAATIVMESYPATATVRVTGLRISHITQPICSGLNALLKGSDTDAGQILIVQLTLTQQSCCPESKANNDCLELSVCPALPNFCMKETAQYWIR